MLVISERVSKAYMDNISWRNKKLFRVTFKKLDGVGPVDNRPSTD